MDPATTLWAQKSLRDGFSPLDVAAAVARRAAHQVGLPVNTFGPELISCGDLDAPEECECGPELVGAVYEQSLDSSTRRNSGVHYTPVAVAQRLTDIALALGAPGHPGMGNFRGWDAAGSDRMDRIGSKMGPPDPLGATRCARRRAPPGHG